MTVADLVDLKAYLDGLEPVERPNREHELPFPWNIRRGIGVWKRLYFDRDPVLAPIEDAPSNHPRYPWYLDRYGCQCRWDSHDTWFRFCELEKVKHLVLIWF